MENQTGLCFDKGVYISYLPEKINFRSKWRDFSQMRAPYEKMIKLMSSSRDLDIETGEVMFE